MPLEESFDFTKRMTDRYGNFIPFHRREGTKKQKVNFFRGSMSPYQLIEVARTTDFTLSSDDADVYDFEGVDPDDHDHCSDGCEINW